MDRRNRYEGLDPPSTRLIRHKAAQLMRRREFNASDRFDIEQDLVLDLIRRSPKYKPSRASWRTFVARVVNRKVATMIRASHAACRDQSNYVSLDGPVAGENGDLTLAETISIDDQHLRSGRASRPQEELLDLSIEVRGAIATMPRHLRGICLLLPYMSIAETARKMRINRSTVYCRMMEIREFLRQRGIDGNI